MSTKLLEHTSLSCSRFIARCQSSSSASVPTGHDASLAGGSGSNSDAVDNRFRASATQYHGDHANEHYVPHSAQSHDSYVDSIRDVHVAQMGASPVAIDSTPTLTDFNYHSVRNIAVPLTADRTAVPKAAGTARPLQELVPPELWASYATPTSLLLPLHERKRTPFANMCASRADYIGVVRRLYDIGMIAWTRTPRAVNGLFGVPKEPNNPNSKLRLIIDARPANSMFVDAPHVELPTPDIIGRLTAPAGTKVYVAKADISDFYHRVRMPRAWWSFFALPSITAAEARANGLTITPFGGERDAHIGTGNERWYPCITTLPMGFSHAVYLAQKLHEHVMTECAHLDPAERITSTSSLAIGHSRHCAYIDDLTLIGTNPKLMRRQLNDYLAAAKRVGLLPNKDKTIYPRTRAEVVGLEIDGEDLTIGVAPSKIAALCRDTEAMLSRKVATADDMQRIVGRWTWCMLIRRPSLAVFSAVYRYSECARRVPFTIWPSCARELRAAIGLAPLLYTSFIDSWCSDIVATDASLIGQGVARYTAPPAIIASVARNRSLPGGLNGERPPPPAELDAGDFHTIISSRWQRVEDIGVLEMRAACTAIRWALSRSPVYTPHHSRLLILSDSTTTVGALSKGRSSRPDILRRARAAAALLLGSGLRLHLRWIPTEWNPADRASRA